MALIWCAVSAHGFGHAAQIVPVLNALHRRRSDLRVVLRTEVRRQYFEGRLTAPWDWSPAQQDVGCIQHGPLQIDEPATWDAHREFESTWDRRLGMEIDGLRAARPALVLSDIPYLAIEAAAKAGLPAIALGSLSWDAVLEGLTGADLPPSRTLIGRIRSRYARADHWIRAQPALTAPASNRVTDVGPLAERRPRNRAALRRAARASGDERVVLIGFGGIPLNTWPSEVLDKLDGYRFVVAGPVPSGASRVISLDRLGMPFPTVLASADTVVTKPGYSTIVEAVEAGVPIIYVRRFNFADEPSLISYAHRYGVARELSREDFFAGRWQEALRAVVKLDRGEEPPPPTGADEAADILLKYL